MNNERKKLDQGTTKTLCLPFFSILEALGNPQVDYFSLDVEGSELSILKTIPWEQVKIKVRIMCIHINVCQNVVEKRLYGSNRPT